MTDEPKIHFDKEGRLIVPLTDSELYMGFQIGLARRLFAAKKKLTNLHGGSVGPKSWLDHGLSGQSELSVGKGLNRFWPPSIGELNNPDVGGFIQVRCRKNIGEDLCINPSDHPDDVFVLVYPTPPNFILRGWAYGHEISRNGKRHVRDEALLAFLPCALLHPIKELFPLIEKNDRRIRASFDELLMAGLLDEGL